MIYTKKDIFWGGVLFSIGDTVVALLSDNFTILRFVGMFVVGATVYAFEIPNYFAWIEKQTSKHFSGLKRKLIKTLAVVAFFNPLWIFRHFVFIYLFLGQIDMIDSQLFHTAVISFLFNIPFSLIGNYVIQNKVPFRWRFIVNAVFSVAITIYYSLSPILFGAN